MSLFCKFQFTHWTDTFWRNLQKIIVVLSQDLTLHRRYTLFANEEQKLWGNTNKYLQTEYENRFE